MNPHYNRHTSDTEELKIRFINIRGGLKQKAKILKKEFLDKSTGMLGVVHTNMHPGISDEDVEIDDAWYPYFYRADRPGATSGKDGGGVALYIRRDVKHERVEVESDLESIWIKLKGHREDVYVCLLYRPPYNHVAYENEIREEIREVVRNHRFILFGDLNYDYFDENKAEALERIMSLFGARQIVEDATRETDTSSTLLDIVITNLDDKHYSNAWVEDPPTYIGGEKDGEPITDHKMVEVDFILPKRLPIRRPSQVQQYRAAAGQNKHGYREKAYHAHHPYQMPGDRNVVVQWPPMTMSHEEARRRSLVIQEARRRSLVIQEARARETRLLDEQQRAIWFGPQYGGGHIILPRRNYAYFL